MGTEILNEGQIAMKILPPANVRNEEYSDSR